MAKITVKELESLIPNDAGRILRKDRSDSEWYQIMPGKRAGSFLALPLTRNHLMAKEKKRLQEQPQGWGGRDDLASLMFSYRA